jgi:hypothetical protein
MGYNVRGVVFETRESLIYLSRNNTDDLEEKTYWYNENDQREMFMCYPLINYSEMQLHPQEVSEQCNKVSNSLQSSLYKEYCCKLKSLDDAIQALGAVWHDLKVDTNKYQEALQCKIAALNKLLPCAEEKACQYRTALQKLEMMRCNFLSDLNHIADSRSKIDAVGCTFNTIDGKFRTQYACLQK